MRDVQLLRAENEQSPASCPKSHRLLHQIAAAAVKNKKQRMNDERGGGRRGPS